MLGTARNQSPLVMCDFKKVTNQNFEAIPFEVKFEIIVFDVKSHSMLSYSILPSFSNPTKPLALHSNVKGKMFKF